MARFSKMATGCRNKQKGLRTRGQAQHSSTTNLGMIGISPADKRHVSIVSILEADRSGICRSTWAHAWACSWHLGPIGVEDSWALLKFPALTCGSSDLNMVKDWRNLGSLEANLKIVPEAALVTSASQRLIESCEI